MKKPISTHKESEYFDTDIAIAGGGLSGLSATLTAVEKGVNVILLEKMHFLGGNSWFAIFV